MEQLNMTELTYRQSLIRTLGVAAIVTMATAGATAISTDARAADDTALEKLAAEDECPKCDLSKADLSGGGYPGSDFSEMPRELVTLTPAVPMSSGQPPGLIYVPTQLPGRAMGREINHEDVV